MPERLRVAIIGKNPLLEDELFRALHEIGVEGGAILSFDESAKAPSLDVDEKEGCRVYLPLDSDAFGDFDAVFALGKKGEIFLLDPGSPPKIPLPGGPQTHQTVPTAEIWMISEILRTAGKLGPESISWSLFQSASIEGRDGIKALFNQTLDVLNFKKPTLEIFRQQLAFNIIPFEPGLSGEEEKAIRVKIEQPQKKYIKSIKVEGATLLNQDKIQELTAPFFRHWLTQEDINIILNTIKQAYVQEGYPNQPVEIRYELKGKVLWIKIKE